MCPVTLLGHLEHEFDCVCCRLLTVAHCGANDQRLFELCDMRSGVALQQRERESTLQKGVHCHEPSRSVALSSALGQAIETRHSGTIHTSVLCGPSAQQRGDSVRASRTSEPYTRDAVQRRQPGTPDNIVPFVLKERPYIQRLTITRAY